MTERLTKGDALRLALLRDNADPEHRRGLDALVGVVDAQAARIAELESGRRSFNEQKWAEKCAEVRAAEARVRELEAQVNYTKRLDAVESELAQANARIAELEREHPSDPSYDELRQRVEYWREHSQALQEIIETERADHDEFGQYTRANKAEALAAEWQQSARDAQVEVAELRTKIDSLAQRYVSRGDQLAASEARIAELETSNIAIGACYDAVNSELAQLRERVAKAEAALVSLDPWAPLGSVRDRLLEALRGE